MPSRASFMVISVFTDRCRPAMRRVWRLCRRPDVFRSESNRRHYHHGPYTKMSNAERVALEKATAACKAEAKGMKFGLTLAKAPETRPDGRTKPENGDVIRCIERASPAYRYSSTPRADRTERRSCLQGLTSEIVSVDVLINLGTGHQQPSCSASDN